MSDDPRVGQLIAFLGPLISHLARELSAEAGERLGRTIDPASFALGTLTSMVVEKGYDPAALIYDHADATKELLDLIESPQS